MDEMAGDGSSNTNVSISSNTGDKYQEFKVYNPDDMKEETLWHFIYNPKEKSVLGRTRKRWGICFLFYLVFYTALAFMWITMFFVAMEIYLNHEGPWLVLEHSRIGGSPALVQYPSEKIVNLRGNMSEFVKPMEKLMLRYQKLNRGDYSDCSKSRSRPENCFFDVKELENCTGGSYGYNENKPCILLRLNRVYSWEPKTYMDLKELPKEMPGTLKDYIKNQDSQKRNMIWLSCSEKIKNASYLEDLYYWPGQGFPAYFYPFKGKEKHLSPIVGVQLVSKQRGASMQIECQAWAKDMKSKTKFTIKFRK